MVSIHEAAEQKTAPGWAGSELLDGGDDPLGHQVEGAQRADAGQTAVRDLDAQPGELVQVLDRLLHPLAVLAEVEADLGGLLDTAPPAAASFAPRRRQ